MTTKRIVGAYGEDLAYQYLCTLGYIVLRRNIRYTCGEIDMICLDSRSLVCVEVKTRTSDCGMPWQSVGRHKLYKLRRALQCYIPECPYVWSTLRIDVISITMSADRSLQQLEHFKNVTE